MWLKKKGFVLIVWLTIRCLSASQSTAVILASESITLAFVMVGIIQMGKMSQAIRM